METKNPYKPPLKGIGNTGEGIDPRYYVWEDGCKAGIKEVVEYLNMKREGGYNFCVKVS